MAEPPVPYTAFVLLAHGRSGSTVLTEALRGHGRIRMYGEICHEDPDERDRATAADRRYEDGENGWRYLDEVVYRNRWWADIEAVGFKLFGDHARTGPAASVCDRLIGDRDIRVVLLERRNLLRALQSYEVAVRTNEWVLPVGARPDHERVPPIWLDPAATGSRATRTPPPARTDSSRRCSTSA